MEISDWQKLPKCRISKVSNDLVSGEGTSPLRYITQIQSRINQKPARNVMESGPGAIVKK